MATAWEKQKAYAAKRSAALRAEMEEAIREVDQERFRVAYTAALNYMPARGEGNRRDLHARFIAAKVAKEGRFED